VVHPKKARSRQVAASVNGPWASWIGAVSVGLGATLASDLFALFLRTAFKFAPSNYRMVGRWVLYMPSGVFRHETIGSSAPKRGERAVGWSMHYMIGVAYGLGFVALAGASWLQHPTPLPALLFGVVTVLMPFLVMQPAFGLGVAASKAPHPMKARLRSLGIHTSFGAGLYAAGLVVQMLVGATGKG
jgi:hypothetical protein